MRRREGLLRRLMDGARRGVVLRLLTGEVQLAREGPTCRAHTESAWQCARAVGCLLEGYLPAL